MTPQLRWYYKNREKALEKVKAWQKANPERLRANVNRWKREKRAKIRKERYTPTQNVPIFVPAPGYDHAIHGDYGMFCLRKGIDPQKSWDEPTDEFFG